MASNKPHNVELASDGSDRLRTIPSVHDLVESASLDPKTSKMPRQWVVDAVRVVLEDYRRHMMAQARHQSALTLEDLSEQVLARLHSQTASRVRPVINATGIILHTGLGRAPLPPSAVAALTEVAGQYASVELDLATGQRGQRMAAVRDLLCRLTGAESAVVVNNNAAATVLALATLAASASEEPRQVIVSRGELIEIGGGFRLPAIMQSSGAVLREVGTTNRTRVRDYEEAIRPETAALMKVHTSNYLVTGFTESVSIGQLVELGRQHGVPAIHDIGSGAMVDFKKWGHADEPAVSDSIAVGAELVFFSGDKLLGGPQAGIILGRTRWIAQIEKNPLIRALRVDKLTLAALEATLKLHRDPERAMCELPVLAMANTPLSELRRRAEKILDRLGSLEGLGDVQVQPTAAYLGGGSLPTQGIESVAIRLRGRGLTESELCRRLRNADPPVVARVQDGAVWLDLRTVFPDQDDAMIRAVRNSCASCHDGGKPCKPEGLGGSY